MTVVATEQLRSGRRVRDWLGDRILLGATMAAGLAALALIALIAYKVLRGAHLAFSEFGLPFIGSLVDEVSVEERPDGDQLRLTVFGPLAEQI